MTVHGTLEDFSSGGILRVLSSDGRSGAIKFGGEAGCMIYLHRGELYFARDAHTDAALTSALVRPGRLGVDEWTAAIEEAQGRPIVGELLVRHGAIHPDLLASVVLSVVYDPLISLFLAGKGDFEFEPGAAHWLGPFRTFPVDVILAEVRRRVREADEWGPTMPSLDVRVAACRTLPGDKADVTLQREEWELVAALPAPLSIRALAAELGRGRYSTARVVHRLRQAGLVEISIGAPDAEGKARRAATSTAGERDVPRVDPVAIGQPPVAATTPELVHRIPGDPSTPAGPVRPRRRGVLREAGRASARRSRG